MELIFIPLSLQVLLFPEGTDLTPKTKGQSDSFARKNGLPYLEYVLHPRTTGFNFIVQQMRQSMINFVLCLNLIYLFTFGAVELQSL